MTLRKTITPLTWRVIVFVGLFVLISGIIGPRIISGKVLASGGFEVYGGLGKAAIFALIAFLLLAWHKKGQVNLLPWQPRLLAWLGVALAAFMIAWGNVGYIITGEFTNLQLVLAHAGIWLSVACAVFACFGLANIVKLWNVYKREIMLSIVIGIVFYIFLLLVYALWQPLASTVMVIAAWMLEASGIVTAIIPPNTLVLDKFGITIAEYCSGVESIALFTGLYAIVGLLERGRLNMKRYIVVFPIALLFLFMFNILRVYGLIMAGYHINQDIAFSLFHTYAGMVFFIIYSALFWALMYRQLVRQPDKAR